MTGAVAYGAGGSRHERGSSISTQAAIAGQSTGGGCRMGYDTSTTPLQPTDDSVADNVPAAAVNLRKVRPGAVTGLFVSEVKTSTGGGR